MPIQRAKSPSESNRGLAINHRLPRKPGVKTRILQLLAVTSASISALVADQQYRIRVAISCEDQDLRLEIESYVQRELRSLKDCVTVQTNSNYTLDLVVLPQRDVAGRLLGYTLSTVCLQQLWPQPSAQTILEKAVVPEWRDLISAEMAKSQRMEFHEMRSCAKDREKVLCEKIVARFDSEVLEPSRKTQARLIEYFKRKKESEKP